MPRGLRWAALLLAGCLASGGCDRPEPSFDDRFTGAQKAVASQAAAIDAELAERERERQDADAALAGEATPAPSGTMPVAPSGAATMPANGSPR